MKLFPTRSEKITTVQRCVCGKKQGTIAIDVPRQRVRLGLGLFIVAVIVALVYFGEGGLGLAWYGVAALGVALVWVIYVTSTSLSNGHSLRCALRQAILTVA